SDLPELLQLRPVGRSIWSLRIRDHAPRRGDHDADPRHLLAAFVATRASPHAWSGGDMILDVLLFVTMALAPGKAPDPGAAGQPAGAAPAAQAAGAPAAAAPGAGAG